MHDEVRTATGLCSEEAQPVSGAGNAVRKSRWNTWLVMGLTDCGSSPLPLPSFSLQNVRVVPVQ